MRLRRRRNGTDMARLIAPEEAHAQNNVNGAGIIRPNTGDLHLPAGLEEQESTGNPHTILLVIVTLALIFISIITYFITQMPRKD
jgi:hypothetical protein